MEEINIDLPKPTTIEEKIENAQKDIYCISGLGADERVFQQLQFAGYQPVHIRWIDPELNESIASYAKRLSAQINSDKPILIGLSFGGIIAIEIAKQIETEKVILVSSAKDKTEIPFYFKTFRWFPLHRIFPFKSILWAISWLLYWFFGLETKDECQLLKAILVDTDARFLKWAIHRVVVWQNETIPECLYHIHGLCDRIFPFRFVEADFAIERGGHLMIMNKASQISSLLKKILSQT